MPKPANMEANRRGLCPEEDRYKLKKKKTRHETKTLSNYFKSFETAAAKAAGTLFEVPLIRYLLAI